MLCQERFNWKTKLSPKILINGAFLMPFLDSKDKNNNFLFPLLMLLVQM